MLGRIAVLGCMLACGCDVVFRVDRVSSDGVADGGGDSGSAHGIEYIQSKSAALGNVVSIQVAFDDPVSTGNLVVIAISTFRGTLTTISDSAGNSYMQPQPGLESDGQATIHLLYATNVVGADRFVVTATATGQADTEMTMAIHEYSGATPPELDKHVLVSGTVGTPPRIGPVTTTDDGQLYFAALLHDNATLTSPGTGYTMREVPTEAIIGVTPLATEDMVGRAGSGLYAEFSLAMPGSWVGGLLTFR